MPGLSASSDHTTYTLFPSDEIRESNGRFGIYTYVVKGFTKCQTTIATSCKEISVLPGMLLVSSSHTTYTLFPSDEICGLNGISCISSLMLSKDSLNV